MAKNINKAEIVNHNNKNIVFLNLRDAGSDIIINITKQTIPFVRTGSKNSILMLTDLTNIRYDRESLNYLEKFLIKNKPYIKKSAILGAEGLKKIIIKSAVSLSRRDNLKLFNNKEIALEWLTK